MSEGVRNVIRTDYDRYGETKTPRPKPGFHSKTSIISAGRLVGRPVQASVVLLVLLIGLLRAAASSAATLAALLVLLSALILIILGHIRLQFFCETLLQCDYSTNSL